MSRLSDEAIDCDRLEREERIASGEASIEEEMEDYIERKIMEED